jgi:hypothetical protein
MEIAVLQSHPRVLLVHIDRELVLDLLHGQILSNGA